MVMSMKTGIVLLAIVLLIAAPLPVCAETSLPAHVGLMAGGGFCLGCPGCPGCPDNPVRSPNEPACY